MSASAVMPTYGRLDLAFVRGEGSYLYTEDGTAYLDCATGIAVNTLGHGDDRLVSALQKQAGQLWHTSNLYRIPEQERLAARLAEAAKLDHVFFCNSGAEANEAAVKMARRFHFKSGQTERQTILCAGGAFHGRTLGMLAATDRPVFREGFGPMPTGFDHVPFNNLNALRDRLDEHVAAIMIEPIQGEGGAKAADNAYLRGVAEAAKEFGVLLIADEVQSGMGRAGHLFAYQAADIQPDLVVLAKGLGGGMPVGAVIAREEIGNAMGPGSHGSTFGGNPLAMAVSNAVLDALQEDGFLADVRRRADLLLAGLEKLVAKYEHKIVEIRGTGFLRGVRFAPDIILAEVNTALRDAHILAVPAADNVLRILPPLTISSSDINIFLDGLDEALAKIG